MACVGLLHKVFKTNLQEIKKPVVTHSKFYESVQRAAQLRKLLHRNFYSLEVFLLTEKVIKLHPKLEEHNFHSWF